ncbi:MAG: outer membrane beta-barrel protein [Betaproteobacteria bacterium]|nr:outer membrane beta-barrel protein [Betaproteobacteria bacterium]
MNRRTIAAIVILCFPQAASGLQNLDEMYWPEEGKFPAYPLEPDERRVRFSVFGGAYRDSNPFRLSDGTNPLPTIGSTEKSDTVGRLGVGLNANLPISRQRLLFDVRVEGHDYRRFDVLDHTAYRGSATWKWQAGNQWSGDAGYSRRRFLSSLAEIQAPIKDMITEDRAFASAGYLFTPRWKIRGALDWTKWDHDEATRQALDARILSGTLGLDYVTPPGNSVGGQVKYSDGDFPNREVVAGSTVDNTYKETEVSGVVHWMVTGKSTFDGRLGYTWREHDQVSQRDFDGVTGRASYDWFVAPKTRLNFAAWREIRSTEDVSASYILGQGWGFGPAWAPTSKLVFQAKYIREDRDYEGDPGFILAGTSQREDTFRGINLGAGYTPRRDIHLSISAETGKRDSNIFGRDYDYTAVSANARVRF